jgi:hypothetical protein
MEKFSWAELGLLFLIILFLAGCADVILVDPDVYHTGKVLENKDWEIEVRSNQLWAVWPYPNIGLGYGLPNDFNIRGRFGPVGGSEDCISSVALDLTKGFSRRSPLFTSGSLGLEILSGSKSGTGLRFSGCYALGFYPVSWMGIYLPLKVSGVSIRSYSAWAFVPGLGFGYEPSHFFIRIASNFPLQSGGGYEGLELWPYLGAQIGIRW